MSRTVLERVVVSNRRVRCRVGEAEDGRVGVDASTFTLRREFVAMSSRPVLMSAESGQGSRAAKMTYYDVLGVRPTARLEVIHAAWRHAVKANHPDRVTYLGAEAEEAARVKITAINEAWAALKNEERRRIYDLSEGLLPARCSICGKDGQLRLGANRQPVGACQRCWDEQRRVRIPL